ncbi:MAG: sugar O-acetyltransferase [Bacteroidia bacterium]|nr:MAG: sugar O-acetyltransferase [Bacteroidia bacterium]
MSKKVVNTTNRLKNYWWAFYFLITLPTIHTFLKKDNKPNLTGIVMLEKRPELNKENWFSGYYQKQTDDFNNDHWAWKEWMVRWNNQLYYSLFNEIRVNGFVAIKDNYVISKSYILSAYGDDFIGEDKIKEKCRKAKVIQDSLKRKNIDLVFLIIPGKGRMCEEKIPEKYKHSVKATNYHVFVKYFKEYKINYLDLQKWFVDDLKKREKHLLFAKFAHHWTNYAECLAVDTIVKYLEKLRQKPFPHIVWDDVEISDTPRSRDADILKSMNLAINPSYNEKYSYPDYGFEVDSSLEKQKVLVIGDSYWYGPVYMGVNRYLFGDGQFWYYYNKVIPTPKPGEKVEVWQLNFRESIENNDVIMLAYSDGNLSNLGNQFIEEMYLMYTNPEQFTEYWSNKQQLQYYARQIRETPEYLKKATIFSEENKITIDSAIIYLSHQLKSNPAFFQK